MTNWTPERYEQYLIEHRQKMGQSPEVQAGHYPPPDEGPESELRKKIVKFCEEKGYPCLCFPQSKMLAWFLPDGWPD